ncbi:MAG: thiamine phosphate synthase [Hydrogenophilus sp.]|nr:thiamine phosphate synthase [Hydrogenophilus sp.]
MKPTIPFWYLITPDDRDFGRWRERVSAALTAGPDWVQLRNKAIERRQRWRWGEWLAEVAAERGALLVINDDVDLAVALGGGVHVGQEDEPVTVARQRLGPERVVGASCYDSWNRAREAVEEGADYVAFGAFFASGTKPEARHAPLSLLTSAETLRALRVAIGGVTAERAAEVVAAGADGVAVIGDVFTGESEEVAERARRWRTTIDRLRGREERSGREER